MFESAVKQNQSPEGARRPAVNYLLCFSCTHRIGWKSQIFSTPSHLALSFGVTPFEFMEKLYGSGPETRVFQAADGEDW